MLTKRQNMIECMRGGNPDRYVNQYEALALILASPLSDMSHMESDGYMIDEWGCFMQSIKGQPGLFPLHDMDHRVIKDICRWREQLTPPGELDDPSFWEPIAELAQSVDRNEQFVCSTVIPGVFERVHHLCEITEALANFYEEPDEVHELIDVIVDYELRLADMHIKYVKPDALFHHDDWGTKLSTFISPEMFEEFLFEPYKKIYGYWKDHGVEIIIHHSDSFGETLAPYMVELGIDVWQGALRSTNDIPKVIDATNGKLTIMGGIETELIDKPEWTEQEVVEEVDTAIAKIDRKTHFIPCLTSGLNVSGFPGVYEAVSAEIDRCSKRDFAVS